MNILSIWYCNSITTVNWNGIFSSMFSPEAGIRQGGILSPVLFAVYVNSLLGRLQNGGTGHLGLLIMGALMYADDLVLVSGSIADLQSMIDSCIPELCCLDMKNKLEKNPVAFDLEKISIKKVFI